MFTLRNYVSWHTYRGTYTDIFDMYRRYEMYIHNRGYVIDHVNGDPTDSSLDNVIAVPNHPDGPRPPRFFREGKDPMGISIAPANSVVLKVFFNQASTIGATKYEYLAPKGFDVKATPFVIVPGASFTDFAATLENDDGTQNKDILDKIASNMFNVGKVAAVIDPSESTYNGEYKWIIAGFNPVDYLETLRNQRRLDHINKRLRKMAQEVQDRKSLKEVFGENMPEEAKRMFDELEQLEAAIKQNAPVAIEGKVENPSDTPTENKTK